MPLSYVYYGNTMYGNASNYTPSYNTISSYVVRRVHPHCTLALHVMLFNYIHLQCGIKFVEFNKRNSTTLF